MTTEEWLKQRVAYIQGLKKPNQQQELLVAFYEKEDKGTDDERKLALLIKAERAEERAQKAKAALKKLDQQEKTQQRKEDTRKKIILGGAVMADLKEGLRDWDVYKETLDKRVTREEDRQLFGLASKQKENKPVEEKTQESAKSFFPD